MKHITVTPNSNKIMLCLKCRHSIIFKLTIY